MSSIFVYTLRTFNADLNTNHVFGRSQYRFVVGVWLQIWIWTASSPLRVAQSCEEWKAYSNAFMTTAEVWIWSLDGVWLQLPIQAWYSLNIKWSLSTASSLKAGGKTPRKTLCKWKSCGMGPKCQSPLISDELRANTYSGRGNSRLMRFVTVCDHGPVTAYFMKESTGVQEREWCDLMLQHFELLWAWVSTLVRMSDLWKNGWTALAVLKWVPSGLSTSAVIGYMGPKGATSSRSHCGMTGELWTELLMRL